MKRNILMMAAMTAVLSCTSVLEPEAPFEEQNSSIALEMENALATKSYLNDGETNWDFLWENGDPINYIVTRNSTTKYSGEGMIRNTGTGTEMDITASYASGDILYAWFAPGKTSSSPSSVKMTIPADQVSDYTRESFTTRGDVSLELKNVSFDKTSVTSSSSSNYSSKAPEKRTVTFYISNYSPDNKYYCKVGNQSAVTLSPSADGKCSVSLSFSNISYPNIGSASGSKVSGSTSATIAVYAKGYTNYQATLKVNVTGTKTKTTSSGSGFWGWGMTNTTYTYTFDYAAGTMTAGKQEGLSTTYGDEIVTPVQNAMPIVATPVKVTNSMLTSGSPVSSLKFNMLAAGIQWHLYTTNQAYATEKIQSVSYTSNGQAIAGEFSYNMKNNPLTISGLSKQTITSYAPNLDITLAYGKANAASIYMVTAPGTYSGSLIVTTDAANYYFDVKSLTYTRAILKTLNLDLSGSGVTRVPFTPEQSEQPDQPGQPEQPTPATYSFTPSLTGCAFVSTPSSTITEGDSFTATITPDEGYEIESVTVTMGGTAVANAWNSTTGVVYIANVTGDIVITATATEIPVVTPTVSRTSYAFFTSDLHDDTTTVPAIMSYLKKNVTTTLDFAGMIGDMKGQTGSDTPVYTTSSIKSLITGTFPAAQVLISYGSHDAKANDDAGIMNKDKCTAYTINYAGSDEIAYYVYSIPHEFMSDGTKASTAASAFVSWAATVDPTKPVVVLSHVPTIAKRGDNAGGKSWHDAMNQVATGSKTGTKAVRNVIFFTAHNHTTDQTEWFYAPGSTMKVSTKSSDKTGTSVTIYYTYSVAGYIKTSKSGTLMKVTNDAIDIQLGKYKSTGLVSGSTYSIARLK